MKQSVQCIQIPPPPPPTTLVLMRSRSLHLALCPSVAAHPSLCDVSNEMEGIR